jgi:hypothetical protein
MSRRLVTLDSLPQDLSPTRGLQEALGLDAHEYRIIRV